MPPTFSLQQRDDDDQPGFDVVPLILVIILFIFLVIPVIVIFSKRWKAKKAASRSNGNDSQKKEEIPSDGIRTSNTDRTPLMQEPMDVILETEEMYSSPTDYGPGDSAVTNDILKNNPAGYFEVASRESARLTMMSGVASSTCLPRHLEKMSYQDLRQQAATTTSQQPPVPPIPIPIPIPVNSRRPSQALDNSPISIGRTIPTNSTPSPSTPNPTSSYQSSPIAHFRNPLPASNPHDEGNDDETQDKIAGASLKAQTKHDPHPSLCIVVSHIESMGSIESAQVLAHRTISL